MLFKKTNLNKIKVKEVCMSKTTFMILKQEHLLTNR